MSFHSRKYYKERPYHNLYGLDDFEKKITEEKNEAQRENFNKIIQGIKIKSHAKKNTMKIFFNDRDEEPRKLLEKLKEIEDSDKSEILTENMKKLKSFINFIKQMSKKEEERQFDILLKERVFHFYIRFLGSFIN